MKSSLCCYRLASWANQKVHCLRLNSLEGFLLEIDDHRGKSFEFGRVESRVPRASVSDRSLNCQREPWP